MTFLYFNRDVYRQVPYATDENADLIDHQEPTVESVSLMEKVRLMCEKIKKGWTGHCMPICLGTFFVLLLISIIIAAVVFTCRHRVPKNWDNDKFYFSARDHLLHSLRQKK